MKQRQIPLTSNTAEGDVSGSDLLINVYPRESAGGKYPFNLIHTPGLAYFAELPTFPILALHIMDGRAFVVTKSKLYELLDTGIYFTLGDVDFSGRVSVADNGSQMVMVDGNNGYYYDDVTNKTQKITSTGFYPASTVTFQDGYFILNRVGTGQFFISGLLNVLFDPLDFATAEGQPDNLVAVLSDHRELFLFGTDSIEIWYNSGALDFSFERSQNAFIEKGCAAAYSIAKQNNTIYFIGSDLMVYKLNGYSPIRISTHAVEQTIRGTDLSQAFAYTYQEDGHLFYVLTIPTRDITWCFDISTGSWHIRNSYQFKRHQSNNAVFLNGKTLVGDFQNGRVYQMSSNIFIDDGEPIVRTFVLPTVNNGREFMTIDSLEFDMGTGVGLISGQGIDPELRVYFSKDGGKTYSQNFKVCKIGKLGNYLGRAKANRFGCSRQFVFKIEISDPIPLDIGGAWVEVR